MRDFYRHRDNTDVLEPVDMNLLVEQAVSMTQPKWMDMTMARGIEIKLKTELAPGLPIIGGDEASLRTALTNLILNACDAADKNGTIAVSTRLEGEVVVVEVMDTGTGMTEEVLKRATEPFFTTKGGGGTGLGLAMVHGIVERHRGKIDIQSQLGKGTTFALRFPVMRRYHASSPSSETPDFPTGLRILVADDESLVRQVLTEYLTRDGHTVETATDGSDALEKFREGEFDVVLTDRSMPEMSGDQVAASIKNVEADIPVIMLTGFGEMMNSAGEMPPGIDLIVSKPVTLTALREALATVWSGQSARRQGTRS